MPPNPLIYSISRFGKISSNFPGTFPELSTGNPAQQKQLQPSQVLSKVPNLNAQNARQRQFPRVLFFVFFGMTHFRVQYDWTTGVVDNGNAWRKFRRLGCWTMEMNGGSSESYLACTPCVPLFCILFNRGGNRRVFRLPGWAGMISVVRWNLTTGHIRCRTLDSAKTPLFAACVQSSSRPRFSRKKKNNRIWRFRGIPDTVEEREDAKIFHLMCHQVPL